MSIRGPSLHSAVGNGAQPNALSPSFPFFNEKKKKRGGDKKNPEILSTLILAIVLKAHDSRPWKWKGDKYCADMI